MSESNNTDKKLPEDTFTILVATDNHLGYEETDPVIGEDSFITFEEILIKAAERNVDIILLGGDLFHHNNPSQKTMNKCMNLLRKYTMGDKPISFDLLCNPADVFSNSSQTVNYLDENLNVSIPVFSIHGNHDDPSGNGQFSALDTLSSAGLVNYFGKWTDLEKIVIKPILLRKGQTKVAIYGLSHIKDDRLCRLFLDEKVTLVRPKEDVDDWYNILVLHQNRVDRGPKRFISESLIPAFINLVIWGHEHDCDIELYRNAEKNFLNMQPGSSVATSLAEGETKPKHVGFLRVWKNRVKLKPLKLHTVRPFVWECICLSEVPVTTENREQKSEEIKTYCMKKVEEMIEKAKELITNHPRQPKLPLIRLRCDYDDETQLFNIVKFGQHFYQRVANPNTDIIRLKKNPLKNVKREGETKAEEMRRLNELYQDMEEPQNFVACVNNIVQDYFTNHKENRMLVLNVADVGAAVEDFIEKDDVNAIENMVDKIYKDRLKEIGPLNLDNAEAIIAELERLRDEGERKKAQTEKEFQEKHRLRTGIDISRNGKTCSKVDPDSDEEFALLNEADASKNRKSLSDVEMDDNDEDMIPKTKRDNSSVLNSDDDGVEADDRFEAATGGRGRGRGRGRGKGRGRSAAAVSTPSSTRGKKAPAQPRASTRAPSTRARKEPLKFNTSSSIVYDDSD